MVFETCGASVNHDSNDADTGNTVDFWIIN